MMAWIKNKLKEQWNDHSNAVPQQRWSDVDRCFYLSSPAGRILYKPKDEKDLQRFRNEYINRFDMIDKDGLDKEDKIKLYFHLYREMRSKEKVKYRANVHTRLKGQWCNFIQ